MGKLNKKRLVKKLIVGSLGSVISSMAFFGVANAMVVNASKGKIYTNVQSVPHHRVGIVLGCSPKFGQYKNPFFVGRINSAVELYRAGKVDRLLVSGDNGRVEYNEPAAMADALVAKGIPIEHIAKDYAGFRTLDTMVRAKKVFGLDDATIITDDFHVARSIYFAEHAGLQVDGFPSTAMAGPNTKSMEVREVFARSQAVLDQITQSQPKFLGKHEAIP